MFVAIYYASVLVLVIFTTTYQAAHAYIAFDGDGVPVFASILPRQHLSQWQAVVRTDGTSYIVSTSLCMTAGVAAVETVATRRFSTERKKR